MSTPVASAPGQNIVAAGDHARIGSPQHSVGGLGLTPVQTRSERFSSYDVADFQPVSKTDLEWKYTPLPEIAQLTSGELDGSAFDFSQVISGDATVSWIPRDDARIGTTGTPEHRASANAWSSFEQAVLVEITGEAKVTLDRSALGSGPRAAHTVIHAKANSHGVVVLTNEGTASIAENVEIIVEDDAHLVVVTVQEWDDDAHHVASHFARIGRAAHLKYVSATLGGKVVRIDPTAALASERSEVEMYGLYFADAGQHIEHQVFVNHDAANTKSNVTYKGALQGDGAHTVWIGDVLIGRDGVATESYEQNRNLLLTDGTRADSVPNLEIETGDILGAGHASTSGRFDDEHLFYLQARGIPEDEARKLVVRGFLGEVVQRVGIPEIEERLESAIQQELEMM